MRKYHARFLEGWATARSPGYSAVSIKLLTRGESDIIWNCGHDLTPTDAQDRFAGVSYLLAKSS